MYFPRKIDSYLKKWKSELPLKPLLLRGARQVGKSSAVREFAKEFDYYIEVDLELDHDVRALFDSGLPVDELVRRLSLLRGVPVVEGRTLLFIDEIQSSQAAIHTLWAFKEKLGKLHVIAAGSLLEFALRKMASFGVGRIKSLFMYPFSFDEFLTACGHAAWVDEKRKVVGEPLFDALHHNLVEAFRTFLIVGGMPECVAHWVEHLDYLRVGEIQADLIQTYFDDFSKYGDKVDPQVLRATLMSVARQVGGKFVYSENQEGIRGEKIKAALDLLVAAGLVVPVLHTAANGLPLGAEVNLKFNKYHFMDSGLLLKTLGLNLPKDEQPAVRLLPMTAAELVNKGEVSEMMAGLELLKYAEPFARHDLFYWCNLNRSANAEVDYVIERGMKVMPLEGKSGTRGSMKSLRYLMELKGITSAVRSSLENFARLDGVEIVPLYALSNLIDRR